MVATGSHHARGHQPVHRHDRRTLRIPTVRTVFILPGNFAGGIVERTCVVAEGTAIYVLVAGTTCSTVEPPPYFGSTEDELRACASAGTDEITDFEARVNGHEVADPDAYRTTSPMFTITFPENNIVGIDPGVGQVVSEAISFIIAPHRRESTRSTCR
jgi:hypothetical protein